MNKKINQKELKIACYEVAKNIKWAMKPVDVKDIEELANKLEKDSLFYLEFIETQGRDPDLLIRAIRYIGHSLTFPSESIDISWFGDVLGTLIEIACPNTILNREIGLFLDDLEEGIIESRKSIED